jgi:small subunit ribosomal protein S4
MLRKSNLYSRPRKPFEKARIEAEAELVKKYALKNKREIWQTLAKANYMKKRAMALAKAPQEEQDVFINKVRNLGFKAETVMEILDLKIEDLLNRRLPTIVAKKKLANTIKHARQLIVHKKVLINGKVVNAPSYLVPISEENSIELKIKQAKPKKEVLVVEQTPDQNSAEQNNG